MCRRFEPAPDHLGLRDQKSKQPATGHPVAGFLFDFRSAPDDLLVKTALVLNRANHSRYRLRRSHLSCIAQEIEKSVNRVRKNRVYPRVADGWSLGDRPNPVNWHHRLDLT